MSQTPVCGFPAGGPAPPYPNTCRPDAHSHCSAGRMRQSAKSLSQCLRKKQSSRRKKGIGQNNIKNNEKAIRKMGNKEREIKLKKTGGVTVSVY